MLNFSFLLHLEIELLSFDVVNVLIRSHENKIKQTSFFEYFKGGGDFRLCYCCCPSESPDSHWM